MNIKRGIIVDVGMIVIIGIIGYIYLNYFQHKPSSAPTAITTTQSKFTPTPSPLHPTLEATPASNAGTTTIPTQTSMANPASVNCTKVGGTLLIQKRGDGGEYGLCEFGDNMACEEWALFRGQCPVGGIKTTGYDTIAQKYCAWIGGRTFAQPQANCKLPTGKTCDDEKLYNGTCTE